jgi:hypothetical protein
MHWQHKVIEEKVDGKSLFSLVEVYEIDGKEYIKPVISESSIKDLETTIVRLTQVIEEYKQCQTISHQIS